MGVKWKSQNRKNVYLSPYVKEPLNSKVIKSFVPELRSRNCFRVSGFQCSMYICYEHSMYISHMGMLHIYCLPIQLFLTFTRPRKLFINPVLAIFPLIYHKKSIVHFMILYSYCHMYRLVQMQAMRQPEKKLCVVNNRMTIINSHLYFSPYM